MDREGRLRIYLAEVATVSRLSAQDERELAGLVSAGDIEASKAMVEANLALVVKMAMPYQGKGLDLEDLVEEGNLGLIRAVEEFDPRRDVRFSTYASYWINQALKSALRERGRPLRMSSHAAWMLGRWRKAEDLLAVRLGRAPTEDEVAVSLGLSVKQRASIAATAKAAAARSEVLDHDFAEHQPQDPATLVAERDELAFVLRHLDRLGEPGSTVIRLRFGLPPYYAEHSAVEVSRRLRVGHATVVRIEDSALGKLRDLCEPC